jgi:hypothetical protein
MNRIAVVLLASLCAAAALYAQDDTPAPAPQGGRGGRGAANTEPQPYDKVITKEAKTAKGLFTVHQIKDTFYYEIPKSELGKDFLWNSQIAKTTIGVGYGGGQFADIVVRWEQKGNRVLLEDVDFSVSADPKSPIAAAVKAADNDTILMSFPVAAFSNDGDPVIDVTRLFVPTAGAGAGTEVPEISARQHIGASGVDAARSFIEHIHPFAENLEAEVTMTYTNTPGRGGAATGAGRGGGGLGGGTMRGSTATVVLHHSMVKLPEKPMMPRLFDNRVGYFTTRTTDYTHDDYKADNVQYIARWRLEKEGPQRRNFGPRQAYRLLHRRRDSLQVGPVADQRRGGLEHRLQRSGILQRDRRQEDANAGRRPHLEPGRRASFGNPLAALHRRERQRPAYFRPAHGRDPQCGHPVLSQRHGAVPRLVFHPGRPARSARAEAAVAR